MMKILVLLTIGFVIGVSIRSARRFLKRLKMERETQARLNALVPQRRTIPLSKQDRRGWATGADGVMRPR